MKTLLIGINAKYIHSNLAIHSISRYAYKQGLEIIPVEYTINQDIDSILADIYAASPDVIGFSCYIWNIEMIEKLVGEMKKILPKCFIFLGRPEVSYEIEQWMEMLPTVDAIVFGEGEETVTALIKTLEQGHTLYDVQGIAYGKEAVMINPPRPLLDMDRLPFIYEDGLETYKNRILYYETSRGCPFNCQYCLSSVERDLRFRSLDLVFKELQFFLDQEVLQVKFVDRTFNCKKERTKDIWQYIVDHDNGVSNFHFEIAADLLDDSVLSILKKARPGLIQLEIGVQSTYEDTLHIIKRVTNFNEITKRVKEIQGFNNTHIHLDLIAGLPRECYTIFKNSFNDVYGLKPDQLQLGFLKVLRGSGMKAMAPTYGLSYRDYAPYEILSTEVVSYGEMQKLIMVEHVLEIYYNSGHYRHTLAYMEKHFATAFDLYEKLGFYFKMEKGHMKKHAKLSLYNMLRDFGIDQGLAVGPLDTCLTYDLFLQEKIKKYPDWLSIQENYVDLTRGFYKKEEASRKHLPTLEKYNSKQLSRMCHIYVFEKGQLMEAGIRNDEAVQLMVIFDYSRRDPLLHEPKQLFLELEPVKLWLEEDVDG